MSVSPPTLRRMARNRRRTEIANQKPAINAMNPEFDRYAADYSELLRNPIRDCFSSDADFFHRRKWMIIRDFLARRKVDSASLSWLDVGCGQGELLRIAKSHFGHAAGCDPSSQMIRSSTFGGVCLQPSPAELPFPDQSFDFVTAVCVYHHVDAEQRVLLTRAIRRVLKPGGLFCLIEHNPWNPVTRIIVKNCPLDSDAKLLAPSLARRLMGAAGLKIIDKSYFLYFPEGMFRYVDKLEHALRKLPFGGQFAVFGRKADT